MSLTTASSQQESEKSRFGARYALILVALLWAVQLSPIVGLLVGNSQSEIAIHFHTTRIAWFSQTSSLVGIFLLPFVVKAAGIYGKKRVMVVSIALGLVGDLIAATATSYSTLLVGRGLAGIYGPIAALGYAMARDVFPRRMVGQASGFLGGGIGLVALGGPFLSGWVIDSWGFRGALWFMAIATALSLVLVLVFVPESPVREEHARMDWIGGLLLGGGLAAAIYGIGEGSQWGWTSGKTLGFIGGGLVAVIAFAFVERRVANPLFPLELLKRRQVWTVLLATSVIAGAIYSVGTVAQLLALMPKIPTISDGLGWSVTHNALINAPASVLIVVMAVVTGALARRIDARILLGIGAVLTTTGYGFASHFHHTAPQLMITGIVAAIGMGMIVSATPIMIIEAVAPAEQALANGAQNLTAGVAQVVFTQLAFTVLARGGTVMKGTQFYRDSGFTHGYWLICGVCLVGAALALLVPRAKRIDEVDAGQAVA
ncbi:MFS transporter [Streptomyces sp. NPDC102405]|uniref:MFS transporter n=1 Tax=Streptomyces sp. NPDC102405 TaxID=3366170 RepID=UPI00382F70D2